MTYAVPGSRRAETSAVGKKVYGFKDVRLPLAVTPGKKGDSRTGCDIQLREITILEQAQPDETH
jgi:UDP-N-acetyl-D-mannosaminuronate dehydrogenase